MLNQLSICPQARQGQLWGKKLSFLYIINTGILKVWSLGPTHRGRPHGLEVRAQTTDCGVPSMGLAGDLCCISLSSLFPVISYWGSLVEAVNASQNNNNNIKNRKNRSATQAKRQSTCVMTEWKYNANLYKRCRWGQMFALSSPVCSIHFHIQKLLVSVMVFERNLLSSSKEGLSVTAP